jgi:hypothetical protein
LEELLKIKYFSLATKKPPKINLFSAAMGGSPKIMVNFQRLFGGCRKLVYFWWLFFVAAANKLAIES